MDAKRREKYEQLLNDTREDIKSIDEEVEKILAEVKERLAEFQAEKEAQLVIYDGYCRLLGVPNEMAAEGDDDDDEDLEEL